MALATFRFRSTRGIKNCRVCRLFKGCSPFQLLCKLTGDSPATGNISYRNRYQQAEETNYDNENFAA